MQGPSITVTWGGPEQADAASYLALIELKVRSYREAARKVRERSGCLVWIAD